MGATKKSKTAIKAEKQARKRAQTRLWIAVSAVAVILGIGSLVAVQQLQARSFRDLSVVGSGTPVVVQVHDRSCPVCTSLLASVQQVSREFSDDDLHVRVAELHTEIGSAFARRHNAGRVTLLYFDAAGNLVDRQNGDQHPDALRASFARLADGQL